MAHYNSTRNADDFSGHNTMTVFSRNSPRKITSRMILQCKASSRMTTSWIIILYILHDVILKSTISQGAT